MFENITTIISYMVMKSHINEYMSTVFIFNGCVHVEILLCIKIEKITHGINNRFVI